MVAKARGFEKKRHWTLPYITTNNNSLIIGMLFGDFWMTTYVNMCVNKNISLDTKTRLLYKSWCILTITLFGNVANKYQATINLLQVISAQW